MRLGLFLLFAVIACALAIWGCIAVIDTPEQINAEISGNDFAIQNTISQQNEVTVVSSLTDELLPQ